MKATKGSSKPSSKKTSTPAGGETRTRTTAAAGGSSKNSKEAFLKKLKICMQNFDYKDENKDAKAKADRLQAINEL